MNPNKAILRKRIYYFVAWILTGAIILYAAFFSYAGNANKVSFSLSDNGVYEVSKDIATGGTVYEDHYEIGFWVWLGHDNEKYLRIVTDGISNTTTKLIFRGGNFNDNDEFEPICIVEDDCLSNGENDYQLASNNFTVAFIQIDGMNKNVIKKIQFRESIKRIDYDKALSILAITAFFYTLISGLVILLYKKRHTLCVDKRCTTCGNLEIRIASKMQTTSLLRIANKISSSVSAQGISLIRRMLYFAIIVFSFLINMIVGEKGYNDNFRVYFLCQIILTFAIALFMRGHENCDFIPKADKIAIVVCASLAFLCLVSDLMVDKVYAFSGIFVFAFLLGYGYLWCYKDITNSYVKDFEIATQCFLVVLVFLSVIKNEASDGRFSGPLENASIYALYLGGMWAVFLGSMENNILAHSKTIKKIATATELLIVLGLAIMSQSMTPLITMFAIAMFWMFRITSRKKGAVFAVKTCLIICTVGVISIMALIWLAKNQDAESAPRLIAKIQSGSISSLLSNRDYYWKEYLRHMNLFGHSKKPFLWDHRILPHNALISMMYWYGVPCVVPYILMMLMAIEKSYRFAETTIPYASVPFYCITSFVIMSMADNVEQPFVWLPWIACYMMMAPILIMPVEEIEALKIESCERNE